MRPIPKCFRCRQAIHGRGPCPPEPERLYPSETPARETISRPHLWAIIDAARLVKTRGETCRIGSQAYTLAMEALELELSRLPGSVWE